MTGALAGKVALVTGASRGIGAAIAEPLGAEGASVAIAARSLSTSFDGLEGALEATQARIEEHGGRAVPLPVDLTDGQARADLVDAVVETCGRLDILVNAAGRATLAPLGGFTTAEVVSHVEQYVVAPYELMRLALPALRVRHAGWIVNIDSNSAGLPDGPPWNDYTVSGGAALYAGLKAAIVRTSVSLAAELTDSGVSVNVVAPVSTILTPGVEALGIVTEERMDHVERVEHIAEAVLDLVTADPRQLTGLVVSSQGHLDARGRSTRSLDGRTVLVERDRPGRHSAGEHPRWALSEGVLGTKDR